MLLFQRQRRFYQPPLHLTSVARAAQCVQQVRQAVTYPHMFSDLPWYSFAYLTATMAADRFGLYAGIDALTGFEFVAVVLPVAAIWLFGLAWGFERFDARPDC